MTRICTLTKQFRDGTKIMVEFVKIGINKNRMVVRHFYYDGSNDVSVYNNIDDERINRDIVMHKEQGYK